MKRKIEKLKIAFAGVLLCGGLFSMGQAQAQTEGTISNPPLKVGPGSQFDAAGRKAALTGILNEANEAKNVILFYKPAESPATGSATGFTLVASLKEDITGLPNAENRNPRDFTSYTWHYMGSSGTAAVDGSAFNTGLSATGLTVASGTDKNKLQLTKLTEGYHYFKVSGSIDAGGGELCDPQEETFVVYVLPQIEVTANVKPIANNLYQFCESESNQAKVGVNASYQFLTPSLRSGSPSVSDFEVKYNWYAVKGTPSGKDEPITYTYADITESNKNVDLTDLAGVIKLASPAAMGTNKGTALGEFFPQLDAFGSYKIFVEVEYVIKDRNYDSIAGTESARKRSHAIYRSVVKNGADDFVVKVTPTPGKPHITIEAVND